MNGMSLMSYMAQQGLDEGVQQLIKRGAHPKEALYGYALAGNETQILRILATIERSDTSKRAECTGHLIRGYSKSGYFEKVHAIENYKDYQSDILFGLAQAGDKYKVQAMLDKNIALFSYAVEGYASTNQGEVLNKLIKGTSFYPSAIYHAARAGNHSLVNFLLFQCGVDPTFQVAAAITKASPLLEASTLEINFYTYLNHALRGYIAARHFDHAVSLLTRGASLSLCVSELKDDSGLPTHDLYIALLAQIKDPLLQKNVLEQMTIRSTVMASLTITPKDLERLELTQSIMATHHLNYIEAKSLTEEPSSSTTMGDITLPFLAEALSKELNIEEHSLCTKKPS